MEQRDMWQEMRKHFADMADAIDRAVRKVPPFSGLVRAERPAVNVYETDREVVVQAEVPGVSRESLGVSLQHGVLTIHGKEDRAQFEGLRAVVQERGPAEFCREVTLPPSADQEAEPEAALDNGLLTVRLKKIAPPEARTIDVKVR